MKQARIAYYNITSSAWSQPAVLFNNPEEVVVDNTTANFTESDVQIVVHEARFVISWVRERVVVSLTLC